LFRGNAGQAATPRESEHAKGQIVSEEIKDVDAAACHLMSMVVEWQAKQHHSIAIVINPVV